MSTATNNIDTIIFDLGGVLIDWDPMRLYRKIFETEAEATWFLENICRYEWNLEQDAGRSLQEATDILVAQHPEWTPQIKAYYARWEEMLVGEVKETVAFLKYFVEHPKYRVLALTNWSAETFPIAQKRFEFLDWFEGIVVSGQEKTRKPSPEIYQTLLKRYQVTASKAIFIDDSFPNIECGKSLGIQGIHFKNPLQLREALTSIGLLEA